MACRSLKESIFPRLAEAMAFRTADRLLLFTPVKPSALRSCTLKAAGVPLVDESINAVTVLANACSSS